MPSALPSVAVPRPYGTMMLAIFRAALIKPRRRAGRTHGSGIRWERLFYFHPRPLGP